jgi:hypothetical protein
VHLKSAEIFMRDLSVIQKHPKESPANRKFTRPDLTELISGFSGLENKTCYVSIT